MIFHRKKSIFRLKNLTLLFPEKHVNLFLNPKVATSTIKNICLANLNPSLYEDMSKLNLHEDVRNLPNHGLHFSNQQFFKQLRAEKCHNFLFVRNPYTRLLSAYLDKIIDPKRGSRIWQDNQESMINFATRHRLSHTDEQNRMPFDTFVRWVVHTPNRKLNIHWAVQSEIAMMQRINYSDIYKLETDFDAGLQKLMKLLDFDEHIYQEKLSPKVNESKSSSRTEFYTEPLAQTVYRKFKADFSLFQYPADSWR